MQAFRTKQAMQAQMRPNQMRAFMRRARVQVSVQAAKTASGPKVAIVGITGAVGQEFLTGSWMHIGQPGIYYGLHGLMMWHIISDNMPPCARLPAGAEGAQLPVQRHEDVGLR
eukprot:1157292-Pelagomonas_calceolata.AAC.6